jgi:uncharacterized membrane protein
MLEALSPFYLWIKAGHIIAVIAWMAGLLYLPRLYFYHCEVPPGTPESERFKTMERRLLRIIVNPAMIAVWVLGLLLALRPSERGTEPRLADREIHPGARAVGGARAVFPLAARLRV